MLSKQYKETINRFSV